MDIPVTSDISTLAYKFATALGIGLLIGAERERRKGEGPSRSPAGIRTFMIASLAGAVSWAIGGVPLLAVTFIGVAGLAAMGYACTGEEDPGQTTETALLLTVLLGALFTCVQAYEYSHAGFGLKGNIYGATFFMATGFHGLHVIIGTIFLLVCLLRVLAGQFRPNQHLGFEFAAWYWHFVDVVWLFLFSCIYVWGSWGASVVHH